MLFCEIEIKNVNTSALTRSVKRFENKNENFGFKFLSQDDHFDVAPLSASTDKRETHPQTQTDASTDKRETQTYKRIRSIHGRKNRHTRKYGM